jgi:hypothetical protein
MAASSLPLEHQLDKWGRKGINFQTMKYKYICFLHAEKSFGTKNY